ncbi:amidase [Streptomyces fulvoviolaceus]|uniref:amidase n=1 Tax=Streptomyces fulvoviolaceus TaxID=285535 RepID=UPI0004C95A9A|nr:amidase [Streptomyces fulvoviolaceus]
MPIERPAPERLRRIAEDFGITLTDDALAEFGGLIDEGLASYETVDREWAARAPQAPARAWSRPSPDDNGLGAWAACAEITESAEGPLAGKRLAIKNNVAVAGLPMANGSKTLEGYIADEDATVVRRVLQAGGTITGTSVCEDLCFSGGSHTAASGPVRNPWSPEHSSGGSSSGSAVLVATGQVDMAVGGDQGGSVRMPASWSGIVGLKPTHGLVPYTGAFPIELTLDHLGPMALTVTDTALLLSVIAGADGLDPRQVGLPSARDYTKGLDSGVAGLRVGVVREGFGQPGSEAEVDDTVRAATEHLASAGAEIVDISVPEHLDLGMAVWSVIATDGAVWQMMHGNGYGLNHRGRYSPSVMSAYAAGRREHFGEVSPSVQYIALLGQYMIEQRDATSYAKAQNLAPVLRAAYDLALTQVDLLCLPTTPMRATRLPAPDAPLREHVRRAVDMLGNTAPFDTSGHPAISVPAGVVDGLPVGMMLVGNQFDEPTVLRAARAFERAVGGFPGAPERG